MRGMEVTIRVEKSVVKLRINKLDYSLHLLAGVIASFLFLAVPIKLVTTVVL